MNTAQLLAVVALVIPKDQDGGALELGVPTYLERHFAAYPLDAELVAKGLGELPEKFPELSSGTKEALLRSHESKTWFRFLVELVAEGFYADPDNGGNIGAQSWKMVGYVHGLAEGPNGPAATEGQPPSRTPEVLDYDVVIVGAGAGGGVAAGVLAESGKRVLLLERGLSRDYADSGHRDHLRNHRISVYGHNTGPDLEGNPRVVIGIDGVERVVPPHDNLYHNLASAVGSGTLVYGAQAWRYHRDDFRMASLYGVPDGSSVVDWPITYDDLEPFYERAEWEVGVSGSGATNRHEGKRARDYPMPPLPEAPTTGVLRRGAAKLGIEVTRVPLAINSVPRDGRAACANCGTCVGFTCPSDGKNGTQNTTIKRALATGRCTLLTGTMVLRIISDARGKVTGVEFADAEGNRRTATGKIVVLSAGAIETPRLMLNSASEKEPNGIGNANDLVGRHFQGHYYPGAYGLFDEVVHDSKGPGVTIATTAFSHGNPGVLSGGMLADDFVRPPILFFKQFLPPDLPRWGQAAKDFMRQNYNRVMRVIGPVHEIPNPEARVRVAPHVTDRWGMPVAMLSGSVHPETLRTATFMHYRASEWLKAAGAVRTWGNIPTPMLSGGHHQAGTCRMGTDPKYSVTDIYGRVWGHDNLFVCDGSLHPTNGGFNPVLTILALAFRTAEHIASIA